MFRFQKQNTMHSKINTPANYQSDETKEKCRKLDFQEDCRNFVNFCEKKSYESIYNGRSNNKFMTSSNKFNFLYLKYFENFYSYIHLGIRYLTHIILTKNYFSNKYFTFG